MNHWKTNLTRRLLVAVVAIMTVASLATYEFTKPARAASAAPAAAPWMTTPLLHYSRSTELWKHWQRGLRPRL